MPPETRWRYRRYWYYLAQVGLFAIVGFWAVPNIILFGDVAGPRPAEFAAVANQHRYTGIVAAVKAYQRDFGTLPWSVVQLPEEYRPRGFVDHGADLLGTTRITFAISNPSGVLVYEFAPSIEGWYVYSPRYDGPVPASKVVPAAVTTQPASAPASAGATAPGGG